MKVASNLNDLIGQTPMLELKRLFPESKSLVLAKLELFNPTSIKDRPVLNMVQAAVHEGLINEETEVVEASSGNTAIALASLGAVMGFRVRVYMSELASVERRQMLCAYGAKVIVTPGNEHTRGARDRAKEYCLANPRKAIFLNQHGNPNNGAAHEEHTAQEIWQQTAGKIGALVIGLGTSGTFEGMSRFMKNRDPNIKIVGFEPASCPVYSGGKQGKHSLIGIGPGFITENFERSKQFLDELILVEDEAAYTWTRLIAKREGLLVGPTSGASALVAGELAERQEFENRTIVCFFYDRGERYLTTPGLFPENLVEIMK
ncbi:MAG: cysteine synthase family protein [Planctomycetes bacterium]|nr:cysteine synthase family protein [Planctomycetota bacterium]